MAGSKKSIYLAPDTLRILGKSDSLSGRVNSIVTRYAAITADERPKLSTSEWMLLCDVLNESILDTDNRGNDPARFIWAFVADSKPNGTGEKRGVDTKALSARIREMSYAQQVSIIEVVTRFLAQGGTDDFDFAE
ncbi:hypothetical protein EPN96_07950 [bacterium]|nr:MAG: hypothetical protein EPN96_07950 [bacterium]